jgi:hypothetical protein
MAGFHGVLFADYKNPAGFRGGVDEPHVFTEIQQWVHSKLYGIHYGTASESATKTSDGNTLTGTNNKVHSDNIAELRRISGSHPEYRSLSSHKASTEQD